MRSSPPWSHHWWRQGPNPRMNHEYPHELGALMSTSELAGRVTAHYTPADIMRAFDHVLEAWGKDRGRLTPGDLAPVDQFHIGGAHATLELAALAELGPETRVLDIGGGFGGPARTL